MSAVADCRLVPLDRDGPGGQFAAAAGRPLPFAVRRVYYLFDVPDGQTRGAHAHRALQQLIVAASGAFDVELYDGTARRVVRLDDPAVGLYVPRMLWRDLHGFTADAVCLVLASLPYDEADYIRDLPEYLRLAGAQP